MVDEKFKTVMIAFLIVVMAFVAMSAYALMKTNPTANNTTMSSNNSTNQTGNVTGTQAVNNTKSTTAKQSNKNITQNNGEVMISAAEAEEIATNKLSSYNIYGGGASLSEGNGHPIWIVALFNNDPQSKGQPAGQCAIDATTGEFLG